jgi:tRNA (mo5U34)-methyltransferase
VRIPTPEEAEAFLASTSFVWHQQFQLAPGITSPGVNLVDWLLDTAEVPADLGGQSVLDIGTSNGGVAFEAERRGASRVVAVDIYDDRHFGMRPLADLFDSKVEYLQSSVYELPERLDTTFDVVVFWGVLYHLRHPLLGLDALRRLTAGWASIETAVTIAGDDRPGTLARFFGTDELAGDSSNWWAPSVDALHAWCRSAGFELSGVRLLPGADAPERALGRLTPTEGDPGYLHVSYERPLRVVVEPLPSRDGGDL